MYGSDRRHAAAFLHFQYIFAPFLEDHYPIKRIMVFYLVRMLKLLKKSVKYAIMELVAEQTKLNQNRQRSLDLPRL